MNPLQLTEDLRLAGGTLPLGQVPALDANGAGRRWARQQRIWRGIAVVFALLWIVVFALWTRPLWAGWPQTPAAITGAVENYHGDGTCRVYLRYTGKVQTGSSELTSNGSCAQLPATGSVVTVVVNPGNGSAVRIIGHDGLFWANAGPAAVFIALPPLMVMIGSLALAASYQTAKKIAGSQPWQEVPAAVTAVSRYRSWTTLTLRVTDIEGNGRIVKLTYRGHQFPHADRPAAGVNWVFWLVGNGGGRVLLGRPGSSYASLGRVAVPESLARRTEST